MTQERLLQFLYQTPIGIVEINAAGEIGLMNAYAARYLMPVASGGSIRNLFDLLDPFLPQLRREVADFAPSAGTVVANRRITVSSGGDSALVLSVGVERLDENTFMATVADTTEQARQELRLREALEEEAAQRGRSEIASSVLHDIGNAITGVTTSVSRLLAEEAWPEIAQLRRLQGLVEEYRRELAQVLGEERGQALEAFLRELTGKLVERREGLMSTYQSMAGTLDHISETLSIQRQYASEWVSGHRPRIALDRLIGDAVAIQRSSFEKRGIRVSAPEARQPVVVEGDRTKLVRVFVNILKNAAESFDRAVEDAGERRIDVSVVRRGKRRVVVRVADSGEGFDPARHEELLGEGESTKPHSRGIGLYAAQRIISGHGGELRLESPGKGEGTVVTVTLPLEDDTLKQEGTDTQ